MCDRSPWHQGEPGTLKGAGPRVVRVRPRANPLCPFNYWCEDWPVSRRVCLALAAALLSPLFAACAGSQAASCGVNGVRPHPEIGGQILYTCYQSGGHGGLFLLDITTGRVRPVTTDHAWNIDASWSPDGRRIAYESTRDGRSDLYVMDLASGFIRRVTDGRGFSDNASWSPDGSWIVFRSSRAGITAPLGHGRNYGDLYVVHPDGTGLRRLTDQHGFNGDPAWAPDGSRIAFGSDRDGDYDIFTMAQDGTDQLQLTNFHRAGGNSARPRWSPDGSRIVFNGSNPNPTPPNSLYTIAADGGDPARLTDGFDFRPDWSPDGGWIVFIRQSSARFDFFAVRADGSGVTQLTWDGAAKDVPRWRPH